jgi:hypothetical protein
VAQGETRFVKARFERRTKHTGFEASGAAGRVQVDQLAHAAQIDG